MDKGPGDFEVYQVDNIQWAYAGRFTPDEFTQSSFNVKAAKIGGYVGFININRRFLVIID